MKKLFYCLIFFVCLFYSGNAQQIWNKTYTPFQYLTQYYDLILTSDGGAIMLGDEQIGYRIPYIVKLNSSGNVEWAYYYDNGFDCDAFKVIETRDKGFTISGNNYNPNKLFIMHIDSSGNEEWNKDYYRPAVEYLVGTLLAPDNGYIVTAYKITNYKRQLLVMKLDSIGNYLWTERATDSNSGISPTGSIITKKNEILSFGSIGMYVYPYLHRINENGVADFAKCFNNITDAYFNSAVQLTDSSFLLGGARHVSGTNDYFGFLLKLDKDLNIEWMKETPSGTGGLRLSGNNNQIYFATETYTGFSTSISTISQLDTSFNIAWTKAAHTPIFLYHFYSDGNDFIFHNQTIPFHTVGILKTDINNLNFCGMYDTTISFVNYQVTDSVLPVYHSPKYQQMISYPILRTPISMSDSSICTILNGNENEMQQSPINILPNPTTDYIIINYSSTSEKEITVSVFNLYGQRMTSPTQPPRRGGVPAPQGGNHEIKIDMRNFSEGIYFVKVSVDGREEVRKVVKY